MGKEEFAKSLRKASDSLIELLDSKNETEFYEELVDRLSRLLAGWIFYCDVALEIRNDNPELAEQLKQDWAEYARTIDRAHAEWKRNDDEIERLTKMRLGWLDLMRKSLQDFVEDPDGQHDKLKEVFEEFDRNLR